MIAPTKASALKWLIVVSLKRISSPILNPSTLPLDQLVVHKEWTVPLQIVSNLNEHSTSSKAVRVVLAAVPEDLAEAAKIFQITIHNLTSCSGNSLGSLVRTIEDDMLVAASPFTHVASIGLHHFSRSKLPLQITTEYHQIIPNSTLERTIDPHNVSSLKANSHFIPATSSLPLLSEPGLAEWIPGFVDQTVSTIDSHLAGPSPVTTETLVQTNLQHKQETSRAASELAES